MMEASGRDGLRTAKKGARERKWMKKEKKKEENTEQIKEHELTQRNKVKQRCKRERRL